MLIKFAIKDFLDDRKLRNVSEATLSAYNYTVSEFYRFCINKSVQNIEEINMRAVKDYLIYCKEVRGNNPTSQNHKLHNLRVLFNYLTDCEYINTNPTRKVTYAKEDVKIEVFTDYQIQQMFKYYQNLRNKDKSFYAYRDYLIIVFLLGTGARLGELCSLQWDNIDFINKILTVYGKKRAGSTIPLTEKLKIELLEYRLFCEKEFSILPCYVFTNKKGQALTTNAIKCIFKRLKVIMNFKNVRLSAHTFRHTFSYKYLMNGGDVFSLQKMLRHTELDMTKKYVNLFGEALSIQNNKFNPLNKLI